MNWQRFYESNKNLGYDEALRQYRIAERKRNEEEEQQWLFMNEAAQKSIGSIAGGIVGGGQLAFPNDLAAAAGTPSTTAIVLTWSAATTANNYILERSTSSTFASSTQIYSGALLTFNDTGRTPGVTYYYRIKSQNTANANTPDSPYSPIISKTTTLAAPGSLTAVAGGVPATEVDLSWNAVTGANNYVLERSLSSSFTTKTTIYSGSALLFGDTGLTTSTTYYYRVKAQNTANANATDSPYSTTASITTA